jgi:hypothetical protein
MEETQSKAVMGGRRGGDILAYAKEFEVSNMPNPGFPQFVIAWFIAVSDLRTKEVIDLDVIKSPKGSLRDCYRNAWNYLIQFGEHAVSFAREHPSEAKLDLIGITIGCIEAETRLIKANFDAWDANGMSLKEAEAVLSAFV